MLLVKCSCMYKLENLFFVLILIQDDNFSLYILQITELFTLFLIFSVQNEYSELIFTLTYDNLIACLFFISEILLSMLQF